MLKARKDNKMYRIMEGQKQSYLNDGYDIYDADDNLVEHSPLKKIKYSDHMAKVAELETKIAELEAKIAELESEKKDEEGPAVKGKGKAGA